MRFARSSLVIVLAASLSAIPAPGARAERRFTFFGAGWGHGVGLSQWGAYGLSREGWGPRRILTHFYPGTQVESADQVPPKIRVGLVQRIHALHLRASGGPVNVRVGSRDGRSIGRIPSGSTWTIFLRGRRFRVYDAGGRVVGGRSWGGRRTPLFVRHAGPGSAVHLAEAGHSYRRGHVEVEIYRCDPCAMRAVAVVSPERYLFGVAEVPSDWPMGAMEAQAVAARTYALDRVLTTGEHRRGCDCAVYASTADQVYAGWDKEAAPDGGRWRGAVRRTRRLVVTYRGRPIRAYFHSSSGGHTESNANVWGGPQLPYLHGVCDPGDYTRANPNRAWRTTLSGSAIGRRIRGATGHDIGSAVRFRSTARFSSGRIEATTVVGTAASVRVSGGTLASALRLRDSKVWIDANRNVRGALRAAYDALACAPGLPTSVQRRVPGGLRQRFVRGALYRNAGRDRVFWLRGLPYRAYVAHGESGGVLGMPRSGVLRVRGARGCSRVHCRRALFEHGGIYRKPGGPGLHALFGRVFWAFWRHGGTPRLGFPTSGVRTGRNGARFATFERGVVRCPRRGHCRVRTTG